jgi:NADH-quinone oxidoreductase subunit L
VHVGDLHVNLGVTVDRLSILMLLVVTGVSALVHIYSVGYMHGDRSFSRFFASLSLFTFSMLGIVLADNFVHDVRVLGAGRRLQLPAHRLLVREALGW